MNAGIVIQYVVVVLIVLTSTVVALRKLLPNLTNRWLASASIHFGRKRDSHMAMALSRRLRPKQATSHSCADGCATCNACGSKRPANAKDSMSGAHGETASRRQAETVPLRFRTARREPASRQSELPRL